MENLIKSMIYIHAATGTIAMLAGSIAVCTKKGSYWHRLFGKIFSWGMYISIPLSLLIAVLPNHENPFLFAIGFFSLYLTMGGAQSIRYKHSKLSLRTDRYLAWTMFSVSVLMLVHPIFSGTRANIVLLVFGALGIVFASRDIILLGKPDVLRKRWLQIHITKISGGFISAVTAFLVANQFMTGLLGWFLPSILGSLYISYWLMRTKPKLKVSKD